MIIPLRQRGREPFSPDTPLHHHPWSSNIIFLFKLKAGFDVNFPVNLFCLPVLEIFIRVERKVSPA